MKFVELADLAGNPQYINPMQVTLFYGAGYGAGYEAGKGTEIVFVGGGTVTVKGDPQTVLQTLAAG